jgi:hypothetical protein
VVEQLIVVLPRITGCPYNKKNQNTPNLKIGFCYFSFQSSVTYYFAS